MPQSVIPLPSPLRTLRTSRGETNMAVRPPAVREKGGGGEGCSSSSKGEERFPLELLRQGSCFNQQPLRGVTQSCP